MDDDEAHFFRVVNILKPTFLALEIDFPAIRAIRIHAAQHIHQSRFSCSVFSYQGVYLTLAHAKAYVIKSLNARECLCNIAHLQNDIRHSFSSLINVFCDLTARACRLSNECVRYSTSHTHFKTSYCRSSALM